MSAAAPLAFFWGDDDLEAGRAVDRFGAELAAAAGGPLERWNLRGEANAAGDLVARLLGRVSTPVMFGGGTMVVVSEVGPLVRRTEHRDAIIGAMTLVAPGNALVFVEGPPPGGKGPPNKRVADAVAAAGGLVREVRSPKAGGLTAWIEAEARAREIRLGVGAAKELATRIGGFIAEGDAERRQQTRIASMEIDKLGLYRADGQVEITDVQALVAEAIPGSVWALQDAVGERRLAKALELLGRLQETTPEPVLLAVLHRRIRELLEVADRIAGLEALPAIGRSMKITSEFRMRTLAAQARAWTVAELTEALDGLLELDAMVKGAPGSESDEAQRRLAFTIWVLDRVGRAG